MRALSTTRRIKREKKYLGARITISRGRIWIRITRQMGSAVWAGARGGEGEADVGKGFSTEQATSQNQLRRTKSCFLKNEGHTGRGWRGLLAALEAGSTGTPPPSKKRGNLRKGRGGNKGQDASMP